MRREANHCWGEEFQHLLRTYEYKTKPRGCRRTPLPKWIVPRAATKDDSQSEQF
jgi:hypothetical protein